MISNKGYSTWQVQCFLMGTMMTYLKIACMHSKIKLFLTLMFVVSNILKVIASISNCNNSFGWCGQKLQTSRGGSEVLGFRITRD